MSRYDTISFLSDFGHADEFVGVIKSVIRQLAPQVTVIDISHEIPPFDVRAASLMLVRSAPYLMSGVVIADVDTESSLRRHLAVDLNDGESVLIGPDNGLFAPLVSMVGGATKIVELPVSPQQFVGRDVYAPVAAQVCNGMDISMFGDPVDADELVAAMVPFSTESGGTLEADVLHIDRYGNAHLNVTSEQLEEWSRSAEIKTRSQGFKLGIVTSFSDLEDGEIGLLLDSSGMAMIVANRDSASMRHQLNVGDTLMISPV